MEFIITTCVFSQSNKSRPAANVDFFLKSNEIFLTPPTLIDIELGISSLAETNPAKAADVREWFKLERHSFRMISEYSDDFHKALVRLLGCKAVQNHWYSQPPARGFKVRQSIWVAAAAISHEIPIATMSPRLYCAIDKHVALPGIYDPSAQTWYSRTSNAIKRNRPRRRLADAAATMSANT
ncbi:MAG: hypothetical protein K0M60_03915 [Hydrogenophaga sp.]|nr:hypothetical protein [Hydrogenophaga sp.]